MDESNEDREGLWMQHARDRMRFMESIRGKFSTLLDPILHSEHRHKIFKERFSKDN